jgi:exonuclease SbcC
MKISKLRIKNLNSLKGEFLIDFNAQPLSKTGIFAITGPTGAGKTTILDAICVALFGRTPRLSPGESEELMTRHTADCYAEVEFAVKDADFRSRWSQRRARGKTDGRLQPAAMELAQISESSAKIIEEKKSLVPIKIAEISGLDFSRFTRSILLAQGSFAAFLNAGENQRADLLEKMTGTEIYSLISQEVFRRAREEKQALADLNLRKDNFNLMPPEELKSLKKELKEKETLAKEIDFLLKKIQSEITWINNLQALKEDARGIRKQLQKIETEQTQLAPKFVVLEKHSKALPHKAKYDVLEIVRRDIQRISTDVKKLTKTMPGVQLALKSLKKRQKDLIAEVDQFEIEREELEKRIAGAELKDHGISENNKKLKASQGSIGKIEKERKILDREKEKHEKNFDKVSAEIEKCGKYLEENKKHAHLARELPLLKDRLHQLATRRNQIKEQQSAHKSTLTKLSELTDQLRAAVGEITDIKATLSDGRGLSARIENELKLLLAGRTLEELEKERTGLAKQSSDFEAANVLSVDLESCKTHLTDIKKGLAESQKNRDKHLNRREELDRHIKKETDLFKQLEDKRTLEIMVAKYEQDRLHLKEGKPCPLCGALEHPWVETGAPAFDDTTAACNTQHKRLEKLNKELRDTIAELAKSEQSIAHQVKEERQLADKQAELTRRWSSATKSLSMELDPGDREVLKDLIENSQNELAQIEALGKKVKEKKTNLDETVDRTNATEKLKATADLNHSKIESDRRQAEVEKARLKKEIQSTQAHIDEIVESCEIQLKQIDESVPKSGTEKKLLAKLEKRDARFQESLDKRNQLEGELGPLREALRGLDAKLDHQQEQYREAQKQHRELEKAISELQKERNALIGGGNPADLRRDLKTRRNILATTLKKQEKKISDTRSDLEAQKKLLKTREAEYDHHAQEEAQLSQEFLVGISKSGFTDETAFQKALMDPDEAARLQDQKQELHERRLQTKARLEDTDKKLETMLKNPVTTENLASIEKRWDETQRQFKILQNEMGEIKGNLKQQRSLQQKQKNLLDDIANQQKELHRWDKLNYLIGSADGKKFRRYAQGLTLDYLIQLANRHLLKLNDRYVLQRGKDQELSIEVIDTFQADVTRPTNTLSGGETFLVSLALALGLSELAGHRTTIDSLFLDEGFGSLDAETLETALAALDSLHASGKTIGIISHIEALKERIPVQIQVQKLSGGVSSLSIVG